MSITPSTVTFSVTTSLRMIDTTTSHLQRALVSCSSVAMVALSDAGDTIAVPELVPTTPEDKRRWHEASVRRSIRLADPRELHRLQIQPNEGTAPGGT